MSERPGEPLARDLLRGENLPGRPDRVELRSTHGSLVFLTDRDVYKVKRARNYGFFDFTTLESRKHFCEEEVRLNRRTAPDVYLGVLEVHRDQRGHSLSRSGGALVDYAVHMKRLPDDRCAATMLDDGRLGEREIRKLASFVDRFYREAEVRQSSSKAFPASIAENFEQLEPFAGSLVDPDLLQQVERLQDQWLVSHRARLAGRPSRDGHGDLRLEHVYFLASGPTVIDCIEFLERFRVGDPALDLAFLAMDLYRHRCRVLAELLLGCFACESGDYDFYPLIDGYMSYRATVRSKVACLMASDPSTPPERGRRKRREAREFLQLAAQLLRPAPAGRVIGIGGVIASGKSTLAARLAARIGAAVVSADLTRKQLAGIGLGQAGDPAIYGPEFTERTQTELLRRARQVLQAGRTVILDTTFRSAALRRRVRRLADRSGVPFLMVEVRVPEGVARQRLRERVSGVSDAREELYEAFMRSYQPMSELEGDEHLSVDGTGDPAATVDRLVGRLKASGSQSERK